MAEEMFLRAVWVLAAIALCPQAVCFNHEFSDGFADRFLLYTPKLKLLKVGRVGI